MIEKINFENVNASDLQKKRLDKACEEFEALFYSIIMKSGRKGGFESGLVKKSEGEKIFTEMMDYEVSRIAAENSRGGIKEMLINFFRENNSFVAGKKYTDEGKNSLENYKNGLKIVA
jgi:flagellar protein FlgJ